MEQGLQELRDFIDTNPLNAGKRPDLEVLDWLNEDSFKYVDLDRQELLLWAAETDSMAILSEFGGNITRKVKSSALLGQHLLSMESVNTSDSRVRLALTEAAEALGMEAQMTKLLERATVPCTRWEAEGLSKPTQGRVNRARAI